MERKKEVSADRCAVLLHPSLTAAACNHLSCRHRTRERGEGCAVLLHPSLTAAACNQFSCRHRTRERGEGAGEAAATKQSRRLPPADAHGFLPPRRATASSDVLLSMHMPHEPCVKQRMNAESNRLHELLGAAGSEGSPESSWMAHPGRAQAGAPAVPHRCLHDHQRRRPHARLGQQHVQRIPLSPATACAAYAHVAAWHAHAAPAAQPHSAPPPPE
jgi:hypothetical protein